MTEISKIYDAKQVEKHWMDFWEKEGLFEAKRGSSSPINAISFEKATKMEVLKIVKKQTFER